MAKRILFQGDSITDAGRRRDEFFDLGRGYALMTAGALAADRPGEFEFVNRGVGANLLVDLYGRRQEDLLELQPDYVSLFIGTNDAWSELDGGRPIQTEAFEQMYIDLLEEISATCPHTRVMLLSPYVMEGLYSKNTEQQPDRLMQFRTHIASRIEVVRRLAQRYDLPFVDMQAVFDEACALADASCWCTDGVHPTPAGHELIKRAWLKAFATMDV
ncbi:MAG: SGNH/GDSL hydrolase family protein [Clostridia bacterium]|nr:SGNH/GDSL hydrolase family protein [Clostridia bacterium]